MVERDFRRPSKGMRKHIRREKASGAYVAPVERRLTPDEIAKKRLVFVQDILERQAEADDMLAEYQAESIWLRFRLKEISDVERNKEMMAFLGELPEKNPRGHERLNRVIRYNDKGNPVIELSRIRDRALSSDPTKDPYPAY